jgi:ribosome-associated translation inhibitor RaiA
MQIHINTDGNIEGRDKLLRHVETEIDTALSRFSDQITRVEVHLGDENADKSGGADKRCMLEARPAGQQPVAVTHHAATLDQACNGAAHKLQHLLESKFGRQDEHKGGATIRSTERN